MPSKAETIVEGQLLDRQSHGVGFYTGPKGVSRRPAPLFMQKSGRHGYLSREGPHASRVSVRASTAMTECGFCLSTDAERPRRLG